MEYILSFLEGMLTFVSPCFLPMLPIYISYFVSVGAQENEKSSKMTNTLRSALGFVTGFSLLYISLGAFFGGLGNKLLAYSGILNIFGGIIVILLGLNFIGIIRLPFINNVRQFEHKQSGKVRGFFGTVILGFIFAASWTPCLGTFLGTALMLAMQKGSFISGIIMLSCFSLGLGVPFILSAIFIDKLKNTFDIIKRNYRKVSLISGIILVVLGVFMATGILTLVYRIL